MVRGREKKAGSSLEEGALGWGRGLRSFELGGREVIGRHHKGSGKVN